MSALTAEQIAPGAELGMGPAAVERALILAAMPRSEIEAVTALQFGPDGGGDLTFDEALELHRMSKADREEVLALIYSGEDGEWELAVAEALALWRPEVTARRENGKRSRPRGYADWKPQARTRALLADVEKVLETYSEHLPLTIRQVYYALVGAEKLDKTEAAYERLCEHLNRARRARLIEFDCIRDDGVSVCESTTYNGIEDFAEETARRARQYKRDYQAGQPYAIELWSEAGGMVYQLATVAHGYAIPVYSAGGFASLSATHEIAERALERNVPTVILHVGDFDPSGVSIFTAMMTDAAAFVEADRPIKTLEIIPVRVALTAGQVELHELPTAPAKASDTRSRSWSGGTCQLEAMPPDVLAVQVRAAIGQWFDFDIYREHIAAEADERAELLGLPEGES